MMADDLIDAVLVQLARRRGDRAAEVLDATFADFGFNPYYGGHGTEVARQIRALEQTGDFAADLATVAAGVLTHFGHLTTPPRCAPR